MKTSAQSLDNLRWHHRVLLVFEGKEEQSNLYSEQSRIITDSQNEFSERNILVRHPKANETEYKDFDISPQNFTVILIGKDGGEKGRWFAPVSANELFAHIDSMPMRQREMQENKD